MKSVVITGATRGIGNGLAAEFLALGHQVFICGRHETGTREAVARLAEHSDVGRVAGLAADVSRHEDVQAVWNAARDAFGRVDIWVNNAGLGTVTQHFHERTPEQVRAVVETNLIGLMNGTWVALRGMIAQGSGAIFNMEGLGSRGPVIPGNSLYSATKAAVTRFTAGIVKDIGQTPVRVCYMSPGMVITELYTGPNQEQMTGQFRRISNILADRVETVAPFLVRKMLASKRNGDRIDWLPGRKIAWRFLTSPFRRDRLFPAE